MNIIFSSFVVFGLTLILTKSKVLAGKREFVEERYEAAKANDQDPGWIHRWWHAMWTCPMCSGFWVAIPVCIFLPENLIFFDVLIVFGVNWLLHCLENVLFFTGEVARSIDAHDSIETVTGLSKKMSEANLPRVVEKTLKEFDRSLRKDV